MGIKIRAKEDGLLLCPFCGSTATMYIDAQIHGGYVYVACDLCAARSKTTWTNADYGLPDEKSLLNGEYSDVAFARTVNAWNHRIKEVG